MDIEISEESLAMLTQIANANGESISETIERLIEEAAE
jgi:predicted CopG family antitoxin